MLKLLKKSSTIYNLPYTTYQKAFTIVELLVVIVVIGILAAITIVSYTGINGKAIQSSLQSDLSNASTALKMFQVENSAYPTTISTNCSTNPTTTTPPTNLCLKISNGNTYPYYQANNTANPQTFSILATNGTTNYQIVNNSTPISATPVVATGGTITNDGRYRIHTFTTSGTLTVTTPGTAEVLVIGGGGGGGSNYGGGGGAGGYISQLNYSLTTGALTAVVGNGGAGVQGGNSVFNSTIATGGGYGASNGDGSATSGGNGGSGGGGVYSNGGFGSAVSGQGYSGGSGPPGYYGGGGGGGAGSAGVGGQNYGLNVGGMGLTSSITGSSVIRGGGGGAYFSSGGSGGGGAAGVAGSLNTGGGGGGSWAGGTGGTGGSGIVIIRYLTP